MDLEKLGRVKESELVTGWIEIVCEKKDCMIEKRDYECTERNLELTKQIYPELSKKVPVSEELLCRLVNDYYWTIRRCIETDECLLKERIKETIEKKKENILAVLSLVNNIKKILSKGYTVSIEARDSIYVSVRDYRLSLRFIYGATYPDVTILIEKREDFEDEIDENEEEKETKVRNVKSIVEKLLGDYNSIKISLHVKNIVDFINVFHYYSNLFL